MSAALHWTWLWVALTVLLTVTGQTLQKQLAISTRVMPGRWSWRRYLARPLFWWAVVALGAALGCWLLVLVDLPVGKAYPLLGANYVAMLVVARLRFGERVAVQRWIGVSLIVAGLAMVSGS